jgi:hypothetical protein
VDPQSHSKFTVPKVLRTTRHRSPMSFEEKRGKS